MTSTSDQTAPGRSRRVGLFALAAVVVLAVDIVTKIIVVAQLPMNRVPVDQVRLLGGAIYLQQIRNSGAAFSLGTGFTVVLTLIALVVAGVIIKVSARLYSSAWAIAFGFILGGALGNLVDRLFRAPGVGRGHVVDFISLFGPDGQKWPIFNLADSGIVIGAVLAAVLAFAGVEFDGSRSRAKVVSEE